jgi:hypothetical protein
MWERWKKGFDAWEDSTAQRLETLLRSPRVLVPSGALLSKVLRGKARADHLAARVLGVVGLPTRRDQERTLHLLNQLNSRILDLEEKLEERS